MANAVYGNVGTAKVWADSGGDYTMAITALATGAGRVGPRGDFGAWPHPIGFRWYSETQWTSAPTIDGQLEWYLVTLEPALCMPSRSALILSTVFLILQRHSLA